MGVVSSEQEIYVKFNVYNLPRKKMKYNINKYNNYEETVNP